MSAAVTGWALRTPLGDSADTLARRLLAGERAARPLGALALGAPLSARPQREHHRRFLSRLEQIAIDTALEALDARRTDGARLGVYWATGGLRVRWDDLAPALRGQRPDGVACWQRGLRTLHPFWLLQHLSNSAHALLAADLGAHGEGATFGGANAGAQAISAAARALAQRAIDVALVVACDSLLAPDALADGAARGALASCGLAELAAPYDVEARGGVAGEAAAALVLERGEDASAPLAYVDAVSAADGSPDGPAPGTLARALRRLLGEAPGHREVLLDGAGQARPERDGAEREVLAAQVGPEMPLGCVLAATGQLGAAQALVQVIALASLLARGLAPPVAGLRRPAPGPLRLGERAQPIRARLGLGIGLAPPGLVGLLRVERP